MKRVLTKLCVFLLLVLNLSSHINAKEYNWNNLTQQQYIDNLVSCEIQLQQYKWSKNKWPKVNKNPKPAFSTINDTDKIRQKVLDNLYKQNLLSTQFNFDITHAMLQYDLNRMASNTKNANALEEMYELFDNDAATIAQCVSRPYLVNSKLQGRYNQSIEIHQQTHEQAQFELDQYLNNNETNLSIAQINNVTFKIKQEENDLKVINEKENQESVIELEEQEYQQKLLKLENKSLQQKPHKFIYTEILEQTEKSIKVKKFVWKKQSINKWLQSQEKSIQSIKLNKKNFTLAKITGSNNPIDIKAGVLTDTWKALLYPDGRRYHTAVWTGTEMIIWGGNLFNSGSRYDPSTDTWQATSIGTNVPSARGLHTAIWTGTEMIVWGGSGGSNTGGRYDPSTDTWQTTSVGAGVPLARFDHTAVWTGTEMIIWGGRFSFSGYLNTGSRYDPSTDSWQTISTPVNVPSARIYHTAIWTGTEMIVWGGRAVGAVYLNTGGRYDPSTDMWQSTNATTSSAKELHTAIWTGTEMIVWGGRNSGSFALNTGSSYDPSNDTWQPTSVGVNVPSARYYHTAIWTGTQMIVWSGIAGSNTGGRYDPSTDSWQSTSVASNVPSARSRHTAIWTGTQMIVWGSYSMLNTGGRYDPITDSWQSTSAAANIPSARDSHTAIWTGTEMIIWGGTDDNDDDVNTGGRYSPSTDSWQSTSLGANVPFGRSNHTAIWTGIQMIVWGGNNTNTGGRYDPSTDTWQATSTTVNVPSGRKNHTAIWTGSQMIVWGGSSTNTGGRYDPSTDMWQATDTGVNAPTARSFHTAIWTGTQMIVWGGNTAGSRLNTGGRYDPSTDSWQSTSVALNVPSIRESHTAIWTGTEMIVWGGRLSASVYLNTGGRYDPSNDSWQATSVGANLPSVRHNPTAIWTGTEMIVWGGFGGGYLKTGGLYDPSGDSWNTTTTNGAPVFRSNHTAVWTGNEMIVWGGYFGSVTDTMGTYYANSSVPIVGYSISGNLTGLNGNQVVLQNNGGDNLTLSTDEVFTFVNPIAVNGSYAVTVLTNPTNPAQTCSVINGTGMNIMANVTNVQVTCVNNSHNINVTVTGLDATNSIEVTTNGQSLNFTGPGGPTNFANPINVGTAYAVQVTANPTSPNQTCSVTGGNGGMDDGSGTIATVDVAIAVNCVTNQYSINVVVSGLAATNSIAFANSGDTLSFSSNTTATLSTLSDGTSYNVMISGNQPDTPTQTCAFTSVNTGTLSGANVTVTVYCNTELTAINDVYTAFEDITLVANDANGSVIGVNDDGVLVNDSDVDGDTLSVANTGTFAATGLTGDVTIEANGTFSYLPPANASGQDVLAIQVTDGIHSVASNITIDVLPVNDAPTFDIMGNVLSAELHPNIVNTTLNIAQFATMIDAGAPDESGQTLQFNASIFAGSSVVNAVTLSNTGGLTLDFTGNIGIAIIQLTLQDDGLTTNGGEDTSVVTEFVVSYSDVVFSNGFESALLFKTQGIFASKIQQIPSKNSVIYQEGTDSVKFLGHQLNLNGMDRAKALDLVKSWMQELLLIQQTQ